MVQFDVVESRIALVTIDLQRCFVDGMLSGPNGLDVVRRVNEIASTCRSVGIPVIHVRQVLRADGSNAGVFGDIDPFVHHGSWQRTRRTPRFTTSSSWTGPTSSSRSRVIARSMARTSR